MTVDEPCAAGGGRSKARKAQRSKEIKYSRGSGTQISSGTASVSGSMPPQIFDLTERDREVWEVLGGAEQGVPRRELETGGVHVKPLSYRLTALIY